MTKYQLPPEGDEMKALLAGARNAAFERISEARPRAGRRRRFVAAGLVGGVALGGVATAAATGLLGPLVASGNTTASFDLGPAPVGSTYVYVTVDVACEPGVTYSVDVDSLGDEVELRCDTRRPSQLSAELDFDRDSTAHSVKVTTTSDRKYVVRGHFRTGLTSSEALRARIRAEDALRDESARTVERTDVVPSNDPYNDPAQWPDPYFVNENGMTIGTYRQATPYDQWPDLVPALAPNGEHAFTYSGKQKHLVTSSRSAAAEFDDWLVRTGQSDPYQPGKWVTHYKVYVAQDGVTIIARTPSGSSKVG